MNINTFLLCLLVIAAYLNLYFSYKKLLARKKRAQLPISAKQWSERVKKDNIKGLSDKKEKK